MKRLFLSLLLAGSLLSASAATYYASPSGSGDGSSANKPCSLSNGLKKLKAGDTLYLLGGQYNLTKTTFKTNGNNGALITICNYNEEEVIFDFRTQAYAERGFQVQGSYIHMKGITLRYSGKNALYNEGQNNIFENLNVYGNGDSGIQMKAGNNKIINCDSYDNFDYGNTNGTDLTFTGVDYGGNADGFADKQYTGAGNYYYGCRAWNNSDDGWDYFQRVSNSETVMENCICYNNGPASYNMVGHGRYETDKSFFDQFKNGKTINDRYGEDVKITGLANFTNWGNGNGFKVGGDGTAHNVKMVHCLAVGNRVKGFDQNNNGGAMTVYNCTGYKNGTDFGFTSKYSDKGTLTIRNCVSLGGKNSIATASILQNDYNTWNSISCSASDFVGTDITEVLTPRSANGSLAAITLMHLKEGSKLIDAGVDVGYAYVGKAPDLGCYEFGANEGIAPATLTLTAGSLSQVVNWGSAMANVTLTWGGSATDVTYTTLPSGVTAKKSGKTITFSGTPSAIGNYTITVTTAGEAAAKALTIILNVKDPSAITYQVAYVTTPDAASEAAIIAKLQASANYEVTVVDASKTNDYSDYDLVVLGPAPSTGKTPEYANLKGLKKPMLVLKPWIFKDGVWSWGTAINTAATSVTLTNAAHPIFKGVSTTLFSSVNTNGVTGISAWNNCTGVIELARDAEDKGTAIAEMKAGAKMNGTTLTKDMLMIGVSEYSTANLTADGLKLIDNACCYLLGLLNNSTTAIENIESIPQLWQTANEIGIVSDIDVLLRLYSITGQCVKTGINTLPIQNLPAGVYILHGDKWSEKVIVR